MQVSMLFGCVFEGLWCIISIATLNTQATWLFSGVSAQVMLYRIVHVQGFAIARRHIGVVSVMRLSSYFFGGVGSST